MNTLFNSNNLTKSWFKIIKIPSSRTVLLNISQQLLPRKKKILLLACPSISVQLRSFKQKVLQKYCPTSIPMHSPWEQSPAGNWVNDLCFHKSRRPQNIMVICWFCYFKGSCKRQGSSKKFSSHLSLTKESVQQSYLLPS